MLSTRLPVLLQSWVRCVCSLQARTEGFVQALEPAGLWDVPDVGFADVPGHCSTQRRGTEGSQALGEQEEEEGL